MRNLSLLLLTAIAVTALWAALPASDSFSDAGNHYLPTYSANWTDAANSLQTNNNRVGSGTLADIAYWNADSPANDQYITGTITLKGTNLYGAIGPAGRVSGSGTTADGYYAIVHGGQDTGYVCCVIDIGRSDAGVRTVLAQSGTVSIAVGDVLQLDISGSATVSLRVTLTRSTRGDIYDNTVTDSSGSRKTSGYCGLAGTSIAANDVALNQWTCGNIAAPVTPVRRRIIQ